MIDVALNAAAGLVAAALVYVYAVCRMSALQFGPHKTSWVLLHVGLGGASGWVLVHALHAGVDLQDGCVLLAAAAWAWLSQEAFSAGPPAASHSRPVPLDQHDGETVPAPPGA